MRLHRLEVTAFGPFAGSEQVDFDALSADGLFLLHGRTGAGKTSVLDAVCFALYGAVPGARSGGAPDLRSHHATPELAPVVVLELTAGGRRLRVERSPAWTRPKRRGEGTTTEQARTLLSEWAPGAPDAGEDGWRPLSSRNDEASQVLTDVLGMALPQFATVVLLPQGEFATFLRSGVTERRALLQRLFSTDRYERAERWLAAERARTAAALEDATVRLGALADRAEHAGAEWAPVPDDDTGGDEGSGDAPRTAAQVLERVRVLAQTAGQAALTTEGERVATGAAAREAAAREHALRSAAERARRVAQVREQQQRLGLAAPVVADQRGELEAALAAQSLEGHLRALAGAQAGVADAEQRAAAASSTLAAAGTRPAGSQDAPGAVGTPEELRERAALHRQEQGRLAELVELEAETVRREQQAREVAAEHDRLAHEQERLGERAQRAAQARADLDERARAADTEAAGAAEAAAALVRAREVLEHATAAAGLAAGCDEARRAATEADRAALDARSRWLDARQARWEGVAAELAAQLRPGAPCPVCGSCEHPAPAGGPGSPDQEAQPAAAAAAAEDAAQAAFERADAAARAVREHLSGLERDAAAALGRSGGTAVEEASALVEAAGRRAARAEASRAELEAVRTELAALASAEAADAAALADVTSDLVRLSERAEQLARSLDAGRARLEAAAGPEGLSARSARLAALARAAEALAAAGEAEAAARSALQDTEDAVRAAASAAGFPDLARARSAMRTATQRAELQGAVAAHERAAASLEAQLAELARADQHPDQPESSSQDDASPVDGDLDRVLSALDEASRQRAAADDAAEAAVRAAERASTAARQLERVEVEAARACAALEPLAQRAEVAGDLARCAEGTGGGNARRMKLSTYVLAARLEQVAAAASERLEVMSDGRYRLVHTDALERRGAGSGLGLRVLDAWTGVERDVATLSGGETFMASLALALGLADVVRAEGGGAPVETLFVDEGFGTLDPESLEEVMGVLEQLRAGGRAVGLVSHVPELRTRVPARLEVQRTATGSRLSTVLT